LAVAASSPPGPLLASGQPRHGVGGSVWSAFNRGLPHRSWRHLASVGASGRLNRMAVQPIADLSVENEGIIDGISLQNPQAAVTALGFRLLSSRMSLD